MLISFSDLCLLQDQTERAELAESCKKEYKKWQDKKNKELIKKKKLNVVVTQDEKKIDKKLIEKKTKEWMEAKRKESMKKQAKEEKKKKIEVCIVLLSPRKV